MPPFTPERFSRLARKGSRPAAFRPAATKLRGWRAAPGHSQEAR